MILQIVTSSGVERQSSFLKEHLSSVLTARAAESAEVHGQLRSSDSHRCWAAVKQLLQRDILFVVGKRTRVFKYLTFAPRRDLVRCQLR